MPIKAENKNRYPDNWPEIRARIKQRAGNRCEGCGLQNHVVIKRLPDGKIRTPGSMEWDMIHSRIRHSHSNMVESLKHFGFVRIICTVAHLDHKPENCSDENLKFWCQKCHNNHDAQHRKETRKSAKMKDQLKINI